MSGTPSQIEYYARALRAPRISDGFRRLGDQARDSGWSHEEYLAAVLSREVSEREASGAATRIKAARFPAHKDLDEFNFDHQPSADRNLIAHLGTGVFLSEAKNVVLLGPPGTGKTHLAVGIGIKAAKAGQRVLFDSATGWVARLQEAHSRGKLAQELVKLRRYGLLIIDLCRARDYAEAAAGPGWCAGTLRLAARHSYRLSRNARILSVGWYRPGLADVGAVRARAFSLMVMSAWTYASVDRTPAWPSQRAITDVSTPA
ncbi:ATP-binding protein [Pseudarthrobacter sp. O4]|uniref:ATP-binding protein n=1 Tax=Pseudarthrobacter sp. O4 TaxID=3418417 RepID=UPI003CF9EF5E